MSIPSWQQIDAFQIDDVPDPALSFAARLARENGWTRRYAERVIREYKRFAFLAVSHGPVCPSEDVDQAWHLHLTYTRSYWKRFCGETLGTPLHHEPTKGGSSESDKHRSMYERTLTAYRSAFGEPPPADIWPPTEERFAPASRFLRVNRDESWVIPKRVVTRLCTGVGLAIAVVIFAVGCVGNANPFNLVGVQFLYFLIPVLIAAVCLGRVIRSQLRTPGPQPGDDSIEFDWQQSAYLNGGEHRLATAVLARLYAMDAIKLSESGLNMIAAGPEPEGLTRVEQAVFRELPLEKSPTALRKAGAAASQAYSDEIAQMRNDGFTVGMGQMFSIGCASLLPLLLVMFGLALPRLAMGLWNGKPVEYLIVTMMVGGIIAFIATAAGTLRTTRRADEILDRMRGEHSNLKSGRSSSPNPALAVALFGTAALVGTEMAMFGTWFPHQTTDTGGCGSGCSGGGGGDGGCGSGCGGCGGD